MAEVEAKKVVLKNLAGESLVPVTEPYVAGEGIDITNNIISNTFAIDSANRDLSNLTEEGVGKLNVSKTFVPINNLTIGNGTTSLSNILPNDGAIYLVWGDATDNDGSANSYDTVLATDIFTVTTVVSRLDGDNGRSSRSGTTFCLPVGTGRTITKNGRALVNLKGYCKF